MYDVKRIILFPFSEWQDVLLNFSDDLQAQVTVRLETTNALIVGGKFPYRKTF